MSLDAAYAEARELHRRHGRTYYLATLLLPPHKRPAVHALYGLARHADDVVDVENLPADEVRRRLDRLEQSVMNGHDDPTWLGALHHAVEAWSIPRELFPPFFASMRSDLVVTDYATWSDLDDYMYGSAAVIGLQMLPILEPLPGAALDAASHAADLGRAFQLTNFIRDVGEDLDRGRLYLPADDLASFGVDREQLEARHTDNRVRRLLAFEIARARELFRAAEPGIDLLHPTSRDCIRTAFTLYRRILDEVERNDYRVLDRRARVGRASRAAVAAPALLRAWWSRRPHHTHQARVWTTRENPKARSSTGA